MADYRFLTTWQIEAPLQAVFDLVFDSLRWPGWWHGAECVEQLEEGDACGVGSLRRYTWKSLLPYRLRFDARATHIAPLCALEATVDGDLQGRGCWTFCHDKGITTVRYEWHVCTTRRWMNLLAPVAHPVFAYNHHILMQRGAEGVAHYLRARLVGVSHAESPAHGRVAERVRQPVNWRTAVAAGLIASVAATLVQLLLWWRE